ncbi:MAG: hypothetical protein DWH85_02365 [Planctomycetota bacterium]|nr:MAG: hypothetical protein DWH85_02365 [Planctomycetota bacterium]
MIPSRQNLWPLILCAIATISSRALCATDVQDTVATELQAAQTAYDQGVESARTDSAAAQKYFAQAANGFDKVVKSGVTNGKLLYNLGNAQVQAKQIGSGIGSYLQAQRIMPGDSQLQSNLAHARSLVKDRFDSGGGILMEDVSDWWHLISFNSRLTLAGIFWIAAWSIAAFLLHQPAAARHETTRVLVRRIAWGLAMCGVILGATVVSDITAAQLWPQGVTTSDGVMVRKGNGDGFDPQFAEPLSQGVEFRVLQRRPGWLLIRLGDGKSGWISATQATTA